MVQWAPASVPMQRRLQMGALLIHVMMGPLFLVPLTLYIFYTWFSYLWPLIVPYVIWFTFFDKAPAKGGRPWKWLRSWVVFRYMRDYFPISLIKTAELPPDKSYLFGYHPHGIIGIGAFTNFSTFATGFDELFPGVDLRLMTLKSNFYYPVWREWLLGLGSVNVSRSSCDYNLSKGHSIMILIGGAQEALDARPGTNNITLKNRKGFVKVALQNGAPLVPVFGFGENNLWEQVDNEEGSLLRTVQEKVKNILGISFPLFHGRGIFNYDFGILPKRRAINSVVGAPIVMPTIENPTKEDIDKWHEVYIQALTQLYDTYKDVYDKERTSDLQIK